MRGKDVFHVREVGDHHRRDDHHLVDAHQVHVAALDYMLKRREIDPDRIAVVGASFGGYWATKLAHVEPKRLRAVVNWGGGIHFFFQPEWQERSRNADSYLFDLIEARANLFGKKTMDELNQVMPGLSLLTQDWLDKPSAPMLLVNGKEDQQVPLEDFYLRAEAQHKPFLEGLIQLAAALRMARDFYEVKGPARMVRQALIRLENYQPAYLGIKVTGLIQAMAAWADESPFAQVTRSGRMS